MHIRSTYWLRSFWPLLSLVPGSLTLIGTWLYPHRDMFVANFWLWVTGTALGLLLSSLLAVRAQWDRAAANAALILLLSVTLLVLTIVTGPAQFTGEQLWYGD